MQQLLDGPFTSRSTNEAVLAYNGTIYQGLSPGVARVIVDMPTPSGGIETVELTVCRQPDADLSACPAQTECP